jgi:hypothetical protein
MKTSSNFEENCFEKISEKEVAKEFQRHFNEIL